VTALFVDQVNGALKGYWLKLTVPASVGLSALELKSHFQLNPIPSRTRAGQERGGVEAQRFGAPLTVTYNWSEGDDWKEPKSVTKSFAANGTFEVTVGGPKYPRMGCGHIVRGPLKSMSEV